MNWKKFGRVLVCLVLVCCILISAFPAQVSASMVAAPEVVAVSISPVVAAIMQGLGLSPSLVEQGWVQRQEIINSCISHLQSIGLCEDFTINVFGYEINGVSVFGVTSGLVEAVRSWLFDSQTVVSTENSVFTGSGFLQGNYVDSPGVTYWKGFPLSQLSDTGVVITSYSPNYKYFGLMLDSTGQVCLVNVSSISSYTSVNFPLGTPLEFNYSIAKSTSIYKDYDSAYAVYLASGSSVLFLTGESYLDMYKSASSSDVSRGYHNLVNLGCISADGVVSYGNSKYFFASSSFTTMYLLYPPEVTKEIVFTVPDGLSTGELVTPDVSFPDAYSVWSNNALTVIDPNNDHQISVLPIPEVNSLEDLKGMVQTDIWTGTKSDTDSETQGAVGTLANTSLQTFVDTLVNSIGAPITQAVSSVFVPSEDYLSAKIEALQSEFVFVDSIVRTCKALQEGLAGISTEPPVIYVDLGASRGSHYLGGKVAFLDLRFYEEYKPTVDAIISAFLWICFVWRLLIKLPGIISGMPGDFVAVSAHAMGVMDYLPSRSSELEHKRIELRQSVRKGRDG